jgi:excisionase family DNA binding protein
MIDQIEPGDWLTRKEAASILAVSQDTIKRWAKAGYLTEFRRTPRGKQLLSRASVMALIPPEQEVQP